MNEDEENNESEDDFDEEAPQESLFSMNSNYNTLEMNKVMKSSTNLFSHLSPLFTKTMTSFEKKKNKLILDDPSTKSKKNIILTRNYFENDISRMQKSNIFNSKHLKTQINFKKHIPFNQFLLGPNNPPSIKDKVKLTSYYKSGYNNSSYKSPEEKMDKNNLFEKYNIKKMKNKDKHFYNNFPQIADSNLHLKISKPYFKNTLKANKIIDLNKQLVHRVNEMTNFFLLKKYFQQIEKNQRDIYFIKKMPKIQIKSKTKKTGFKKEKDYNEGDGNNDKENNKKNKKIKGIDFLQPKNINYLGAIKLDRFRKFAYNGLIESQCEEDDDDFNILNLNKNLKANKKVSFNSDKKSDDNENKNGLEKLLKKKFEKHYLSLNISKLCVAFKPSSRIDFSMSKLDNKIYIYGGVSSKIYNELWVFNIDKNKWTQIAISEKDDPTARKGHTSVIIKDMMFIYGGEIPKERPYEDLITYNITTNKFYYPKIPLKRKINQRIGHICVGTNQTFLIQGGMDSRTHDIENSAFFYNIYGNYWQRLDCIGQPLPYRIYHSAVMVNYYSKSSSAPYSFYFPPDDFQEGQVRKIRYEGIYIFGGINDKKNYTNDLFIIKIGHKPCVNIKPKIAGIPPEPRIKAKMAFLDNYYFIIIHGGVKINQHFCNDITVLNLENYNWIRPIISDENNEGKNLMARIEHQIFFHEEKLYIFGGLGEENILSMNFEIVEFEVTGFYENFMHPDQIEID